MSRENLNGKSSEEKPNVPLTLGGSLLAFITGAALLFDDAKDFGKLDTSNHPSPLHHWLLGVVLMVGGVAGLGVSFLDLMASDPEVAKAVLEGAKELEIARKALPPKELEKLLHVH